MNLEVLKVRGSVMDVGEVVLFECIRLDVLVVLFRSRERVVLLVKRLEYSVFRVILLIL